MLGTLYSGESFFLDRIRTGIDTLLVFEGGDIDGLFDTLTEPRMGEAAKVVWSHAEEFKIPSKWSLPQDGDASLSVFFYGEKPSSAWLGLGLKHEHFKPFKPFGKDYENFLKEEAARYDLRFEDAHIPTVLSFLGNDLYRIASEVKKLSFLCPRNSTIPATVLKEVLSPGGEVPLSKIGDSFLQGDRKKTEENLYHYLQQNDSVLPLLAYLTRHLEKILWGMDLQGNQDAASILEMNPWRYQHHFAVYFPKHTEGKLIALLRDLVEVEYRVKTGKPYLT